jgi:hypothetical protein
MPRPGSRVIAAGWEAHHRPVAESTFTAIITFKRPDGAPVFDPDTGTTTQPTVTVYSGPCRIQELQREHTTIDPAQRITIRRYQVSLTIQATGLRLDDVGTVDAANDPSLIGRGLRVIDVQRGSLTFQRDLIVTDNLEV